MEQVLNIADLDAQDEASFAVRHPKTGAATSWVWTFYGPAHPASVAVADRAAREAIRHLSEQRQAQANGRKWKPTDETPDELRIQNVENIVGRTKGFTPIDLGSGAVEYTPEAARSILLDRRRGWLLTQITEFLRAEENFIQPSATS